MKPNGYILYEGLSQLDGRPIVAIATGFGKSANRKTGAMIQTWIIRADQSPIAASKSGADASVCGDCPHRWHTGGACYVNIGQAPGAVYRAYKRGRYPFAGGTLEIIALGAGRAVRIGSYGDPAAVPAAVWRAFIRDAAMHTGYTHQWARPDVDLRDVCMASADSASLADSAQAMGYRTFRIHAANDTAKRERESVCPASEEAGHKLTCAECGACNGTATARRGSIVIAVHGSLASRFKAAA